MKSETDHIKKSFSQAENYDDYAIIQPIAASLLTDLVSERLRTRKIRRILELGAGTGTLSLKISALFPRAEYICTDLSEKMLQRAQEKLKNTEQNFTFLPLDINHLADCSALTGGFDLIISNLAFQWVEKRAQALAQIHAKLNHEGSAFLSTLLKGSLNEWRFACEKTETQCHVPLYPSTETLEAEYKGATWKNYQIKEDVPNGLSFLKGLKKIGAAPQHAKSPNPNLKKSLRFFDEHYQHVSYEIGLGELYK